jgi:hypothetical protein
MTPAIPTAVVTRRSAFPFRTLRRVPITAVGTMTSNDVPFATASGDEEQRHSTGTITMPPPTPRSPAGVPREDAE